MSKVSTARPEIKVESYMGTPMMVLYYGRGNQFKLRLTKKKIGLLESYMPIAKQFVKAVDENKLEDFKKELESLGYSQTPIAPLKSDGLVVNEDGELEPAIKSKKTTETVVSESGVTFK